VLGFSIVLIAFEVFTATSFTINYRLLTEVTFYEGAIIAVLLTAVILTVFSSSRLASVAAMGVIGLTICIIFVFYSAPDLAITQFTIDTLTVILFVLVLYKLPRFIPLRWSWRHLMDGLVSLSFGFLISIITLEVLTKSPNRDISAYYAQNSYVLAKGKNIVNVILVDFRGADTMIEIVVLSIAAIGVFSLLKLRLPKNERIE
jgi:multicomponent Na+:H+ antiporter subunit A